MKRLVGARSICLDAYGTDSYGKKYDLEIQRADNIGKLMHDFRCSDPDDMLDEQLAAKTKYYKETEEGVAIVCKAIEDMRNDTSVRTYVEACRDFGIVDQNEIVKKLLEKFKFLTEAQARKYVS